MEFPKREAPANLYCIFDVLRLSQYRIFNVLRLLLDLGIPKKEIPANLYCIFDVLKSRNIAYSITL